MPPAKRPAALAARDVAPNPKPSNYPEPFYARMKKREKRALGDRFGLRNFGVNLARLAPGGESALRHGHSAQDEFIYVLEGEPVLISGAGETPLQPGLCAGFAAGTGDAHCLVNRSSRDVWYLEVGDRSPNDVVEYPDDDIRGVPGPDVKRIFVRKNGGKF